MSSSFSNIVLTGFMGTGKTEVGKRLAQLLEMDLIDTDIAIEAKVGLTIPEIFHRSNPEELSRRVPRLPRLPEYGERRFREEETAVIRQVAAEHGCVIATGGGAVLNPENVQLLREKGVIILLTAQPAVIAARVSKSGGRPLLQGNDPHSDLELRIKDLLVARAPYYQDCDYQIDTTELSVEEVAAKIISFLDGSREPGGGWKIGNTTG